MTKKGIQRQEKLAKVAEHAKGDRTFSGLFGRERKNKEMGAGLAKGHGWLEGCCRPG